MEQLKIYKERWEELKPLLGGGNIGPSTGGRRRPCFVAELVRREREKRGIVLRLAWIEPKEDGYQFIYTVARHDCHLTADNTWSACVTCNPAATYPYHAANVIGLIEGAKT